MNHFPAARPAQPKLVIFLMVVFMANSLERLSFTPPTGKASTNCSSTSACSFILPPRYLNPATGVISRPHLVISWYC
jgi:hypothetical protein